MKKEMFNQLAKEIDGVITYEPHNKSIRVGISKEAGIEFFLTAHDTFQMDIFNIRTNELINDMFHIPVGLVPTVLRYVKKYIKEYPTKEECPCKFGEYFEEQTGVSYGDLIAYDA